MERESVTDNTEEFGAVTPPATSDDLATMERARPVRLAMYLGAGLVVVGLIVLYAGYNGAATNPVVEAQIPYVISGGILGAALILLGGVGLAISVYMQGQERLQSEIARLEEALERVAESAASRGPGLGQVSHSQNGYVVVPKGGSSFHEAGCRIVQRSKESTPLSRGEAERTGLTPCRICKP